MTCAHLNCGRTATHAYRGGNKLGRPRAGLGAPLRYCPSHYEQLRRGAVKTKDLRPRGVSAHARAVAECADIAEHNGHAALAALFRRLANGSANISASAGRAGVDCAGV